MSDKPGPNNCPVCQKRVPYFRHVLINRSLGFECPSCHSGLKHMSLFGWREILGLLLFLFSLQALHRYSTLWLEALCVVGIVFGVGLVFWGQRFSMFKVVYLPNGRNP